MQCTGSRRGEPPYDIVDDATVLDVADVRAGVVELPADGQVVLLDPIGGPIAVALAEELGERAMLVTQDLIAGNELSRTGDLAPANVRLQQRGVHIERHAVVRAVRRAPADTLEVDVDDRFTGPAADPRRAQPWSTAASASRTSRCPEASPAPGTASPPARSTRRCWKGAGPPSPSDTGPGLRRLQRGHTGDGG